MCGGWPFNKKVENPNENTICIQGGLISSNDPYLFHFLLLYFAFHVRILRQCMLLVCGLTEHETLNYSFAINICCTWQTLQLQSQFPSGLTWAVTRVVIETLQFVVQQYFLNHTRGYWLFFDASVACIVICMKLQVDWNTR